MELVYIGIDISKETFDVAVILPKGKIKQLQFSNQRRGHRTFQKWLAKRGISRAHVAMEATGLYGQGLASFLHEHGYTVSVVNPARIKAYGESKLLRNKTDAIAAELIADFCFTQKPEAWTPPSPEIEKLRGMTRHLADLKKMRTQEINRQKSGISEPVVLGMVAEHLAFLNQAIKELEEKINAHIAAHPPMAKIVMLLESIPGIGRLTAAILVAEIEDINLFSSAAALAAFVGLTPKRHESGKSVRKRATLSKMGRVDLRTALYLPTLSARRVNPLVRSLSARLFDRGKSRATVRGACMRKLLYIVYGVWKNGIPFDPMYEQKRQNASLVGA